MDLIAAPKKELLYPTPGTILVGREDFVALPTKKSILRPFGSTKLTVPLNEQWMSLLKMVKVGRLYGGIHLRSNAAQAQLDITAWDLSETVNGIQAVVSLTNFSSDIAEINAGTPFKLGNPYAYERPLEGDELVQLANGISLHSERGTASPRILRKDDLKNKEYEGDPLLFPTHDLLVIPLTKAHPNKVLHKKFVPTDLPSGPDRERLHKTISIHGGGIEMDRIESSNGKHDPTIQLASTPSFTMPSGTALALKSCVKNIEGIKVLVPHSASNIHRSEALVAGTSPYVQGEQYEHRVITESYNFLYPDKYPSEVYCEAFNLLII
ncbi:MAG: hypothetical protein WAV29_00455 [Microgenomates group bacterium]